jgi:indolepyruvate ferredoxin oxidoreductase, alpha subunit
MAKKIIQINQELCTRCGICIEQFGCPSFYREKEGSIHVSQDLCNNNGSCRQVCPENAIEYVDQEDQS